MLPGRVHPRHARGRGYTFFGAIQNSSNIVCGKLGIRLGAERLYRYATSLGFGELTGIEFPGETGGKLRPVSAWQPRSTPTIAIGQEVAVTPLQLALAYAAIANGGVLMQPLLTRELRDDDGRVLRRWAPQPARRVFSEATTADAARDALRRRGQWHRDHRAPARACASPARPARRRRWIRTRTATATACTWRRSRASRPPTIRASSASS